MLQTIISVQKTWANNIHTEDDTLLNVFQEAYTNNDKLKKGRTTVENVFLLILMIVIGAAIGGVTNSLAIKMLFRPYQPIMIGKWKLPFTPGLIPKRRAEIAEQLGEMVVEYLLTPEGLKKKLLEPAFKKQVTDWAQAETNSFLDKQTPIGDLLKEAGFSIDETMIKEKLTNQSWKKVQNWTAQNHDKKIHEFIQGSWQDKTIKAGVNLVDHLQQQLINFAESPAAKEKIEDLIENFLDNRGFMANMISSFMGNEEIARKIQPVIVSHLKTYEMKTLLKEMVGKELTGILYMTVGEIEDKIGKKEIEQAIHELADMHIQADFWLSRSLSDWLGSYRLTFVNKIIPALADTAGQGIVSEVESLMKHLHLAEIVEKEVSTFPISRLENLLLDISRKEFRMITYLGILLGGLIGLFQGILVLVIS